MSGSQRAIQRCYAFLEEHLSPLDALLSILYQEGLIDKDRMTQIRRTTDPREQVGILLLDCLSGRSLNDLRRFCDILLESERSQSMFTHGEAARKLSQEIDLVEREGVPSAPRPNPGPSPQSSSSSTGSQTSSSGASANWTFPNFPPGFPFHAGGFPNIQPGSNSTIIVGNKIENSQITVVGSASNSSVSINGGRPRPHGPRYTAPSGGGVSQGHATPTPHDYPPPTGQQPTDDPPLSTQESPDPEPRFSAEPTPEQFIHVLSVIEGSVYEFYRVLGVPVAHERDGGTAEENAARMLRENPGITWRRVLEALRRMGRADKAGVLEQRIRFGGI